MTIPVDLLICDPKANGVVAELGGVGLNVVLANDYYSLFEIVNKQQPRAIAGALQEDLWSLEDFCMLFKSENHRVPLVFYGDSINEHLRLSLMELGADEVVSQNELKGTILGRLGRLNKKDSASSKFVVLPNSQPEKRYASYVPFDSNDLTNVLHFVAMSRKTGVLEIMFDHSTGVAGKVYTADARITHAVCEDLKGIEALACMMRQGSGKAGLIPGVKAPMESITLPLDHLLIEASVQADEVNTSGY